MADYKQTKLCAAGSKLLVYKSKIANMCGLKVPPWTSAAITWTKICRKCTVLCKSLEPFLVKGNEEKR